MHSYWSVSNATGITGASSYYIYIYKYKCYWMLVKSVCHNLPKFTHTCNLVLMTTFWYTKNISELIGWNNNNHLDNMAHINLPNCFFLRPNNCYLTENIFFSLKNKSSNLNTIPAKFLKSICDLISSCLMNIIIRTLTMHWCISS